MVLVDTCVWIDFLQGRSSPIVQLLETFLADGEACICEVTFAEICFGAKEDRQFRKFSTEFSQIPFLSLPAQWHQQIAQMGYQLKRHGHAPFLADLQIALTAIHHTADLLTTDKDFLPYHTLFGVSVLGIASR